MAKKGKKTKKKQRYWYKYDTTYCPLCGKTDTFKYRVYGPKPKRYEDRHVFHEAWDYCPL